MIRFRVLIIALLSLLLVSSADRHITIFMVGDSTMANKPYDNNKPERGWGMALEGFFDDHVIIENHAVNGRSSKSFIDEGRWQTVVQLIKPGDYVIIQFGHNDEKPQADRHTDPGTTFDANLRKFIEETRAKGGIPILMNSVVRRNFQQVAISTEDNQKLRETVNSGSAIDEGSILVDTHGEYVIAPRNVAKATSTLFVDANAITHDLEQSLGPEESKKLHMWFKPGDNPSLPKGCEDNTHYSIYGAHIVAGLLAEEIGKSVPVLRRHVRHYDFIVAADGKGNYMDLQQAVDNASWEKKTTIRILNGEWHYPVIPKGKRIKFSVSRNAILRKD